MMNSKITDSEIIKAYKDYLEVERGYSIYTVSSYLDDIKEFTNYLKEKKISSITTVSVNVARYYLMELNKNSFKATSVSRKISSLRGLYRFMIMEGYVIMSLMKYLLPNMKNSFLNNYMWTRLKRCLIPLTKEQRLEKETTQF